MKNATTFQRVALLAALLNLLASLAMLLFLKPGLMPELPLANRIDYLINHSFLWTGSWLLWIFAAVSLILFLIHWGTTLDRATQTRHRPWIIFGVLIACLGMVPDTIAETIYFGLLPRLAADVPNPTSSEMAAQLTYLHWERLAQMLTGFLGNSFYCLGGLTLQIVTLKTHLLPRFCRYAGFLVWLAGFGLSIATLTGSMIGLTLFTALTMAGFVAWAMLIFLLPQPEPNA